MVQFISKRIVWDFSVNGIKRNSRLYRLITASVILLSLAGCGSPLDEPGKPKSLFKVLTLEAHANPLYSLSGGLYEKPLPARWSPYAWAQNAAALDSLSNDKERLNRTADELLRELAKHSDDHGALRVVRYDFTYVFDQNTLSAPWYSALGNSIAAIGLMHISEATGRKDVNEFALSYLKAIEPELSHRDDKGRIWFSEYVTTSLPEGRVDVINGHFGSIVAFYEWRNRNKDRQFDEIIIAGLKTMHDYLPLMIQDGYFFYARGYPHIKITVSSAPSISRRRLAR